MGNDQKIVWGGNIYNRGAQGGGWGSILRLPSCPPSQPASWPRLSYDHAALAVPKANTKHSTAGNVNCWGLGVYRFWQLRQYSYIHYSLLALPYIKQRRRPLLNAIGNPFPLFKLAKLEAGRWQCTKRRDTCLDVLR